MRIGTKTVLFGYHCIIIHPCFVFFAWWKLYGFPWDPRLWVAFFVHDIGYLGKKDMVRDAEDTHPELGAHIMHFLFDWWPRKGETTGCSYYWYNFTLYHSRRLARKRGAEHSKLCIADKLALCLTPSWMILLLSRLTGEINHYMGSKSNSKDQVFWCDNIKKETRSWLSKVSLL